MEAWKPPTKPAAATTQRQVSGKKIDGWMEDGWTDVFVGDGGNFVTKKQHQVSCLFHETNWLLSAVSFLS